MKTLATMTAIAALVAGISVAGAQNSAAPSNSNASPSDLNARPTDQGSNKNSGTQTPAAKRHQPGPVAVGPELQAAR
jgi:hypothetical protein